MSCPPFRFILGLSILMIGSDYMYSISVLSKEFNLSRSTLLYYESIDLLCASERTEANYRLYSDKDKARLSKICSFREAGVPLEQIKELLNSDGSSEQKVLEARLTELNKEIRYLRLQQKIIVEMLKSKDIKDKSVMMDKKTFISILKSSGVEDNVFNNLHTMFEKISPSEHQIFLEFLGMSDEEIKEVRSLAKEAKE
jgi:DNA-binding transcriptional MerR regulator